MATISTAWSWEAEAGSSFRALPLDDSSTDSGGSKQSSFPNTPDSSPGWETDPLVTGLDGEISFPNPAGDEHLALAAKCVLLEGLSDGLQSQAKSAVTASPDDNPLPGICTMQPEDDLFEGSAMWNAFPHISELNEYLGSGPPFPDSPRDPEPWAPSEEDGGIYDLDLSDVPLDDFLKLDEIGGGPGASANTHTEIISRGDAGMPPEGLSALLVPTMSALPRKFSSVCLRPSYLHPNQKQRLCTPPEDDDDVIFIKSVPRHQKRAHNNSGPSDDYSSPAKHPGASRVNVLLTQVTRQFYDGDREYVRKRGADFWQDKKDGTQLRFDEGEDYKTLKLEVRPHGLSGMPVLLSWDEGIGVFRGYDIAGADRSVGKDVVFQLLQSVQSEVDWPQLGDLGDWPEDDPDDVDDFL